jgi:uncharacterized protein (UPF0332 family)
VRRDLVKPGLWQASLGQEYSTLAKLREKGDYGGGRHAEPDEARSAIEAATRILDAVRTAHPELERER